MAQWNLSVDLRGQGTSLARSLQQSARHARTLASAVRAADQQTAALGRTSRNTSSNLAALRRQATGVSRDLRQIARAAAEARRALDQVDRRLQVRIDGDSRNVVAAAAAANRALRSIDRHVQVRISADSRSVATAASSLNRSLGGINRSMQVRIGADARNAVTAATAARRALDRIDRHIQVRVDADTRGATTAAADLRRTLAGIDRNVRVQVRVDTDASAAAAAAALRTVRAAATDTSNALRILERRASNAADGLDDIIRSALAAAGALRTLDGVTDTTSTRLHGLAAQTRNLRTDLDSLDGTVGRVHTRLGSLGGQLRTAGDGASDASGETSNLIQAVVALGTAIIPVAASLAPIAAGLGAAGAAAAAYGLAIGGQIVQMSEAAEAQQKYDDAVSQHGRHSEEAAKAEGEWLRQVKSMPPATRQAAAALSVLKDEYGDWSDMLAADTMPSVTKGLQLATMALPKFTPMVRGASRELDRFLNVAAGGMATPGFDRFMSRFAEFSTATLARATSGLVRLTQAMDTGNMGSGLKEFMDWARSVGPIVGETFSNLTEALFNLLEAASDMGVGVLTAVNALAQLVNAVPPEALSVFIQLYAAFKLVAVGIAAVGAVAGGSAAAGLAAFIRSARFGGLGAAIGGVTQRMSAMSKVAGSLGVIGAAAIGIDMLAEKARGAPPDVDRLTSSLKELAATGGLKFSGELAKTFGSMDEFVAKAARLESQTADLEKAKDWASLIGLGTVADVAGRKLEDLVNGADSLTALEEDFKSFDKAFAQMATSGYADQAAKSFEKFEHALRESGKSSADIAKMFPEYKAAVAGLKAEQELAAQGMGLFGAASQSVQSKLDAQKASADGLRQSLVALNDVNRASLGGMNAFEAAIDAAAKVASKHKGALKMVNGELDLNSEAARNADTALRDLAAKTDEAATAARQAEKPWEYVNGIYERGRKAIVDYAGDMGLGAKAANQLANQILQIPEQKVSTIEMRREDAIAGLDQVIKKMQATPGAKSIKVNALTADARALLESLGYRVKTLPDGRVQVTALTGSALGGLRAVKAARDSLSDKTITITTNYRVIGQQARRSGSHGTQLGYADGGVVDYYADGGLRGPSRQRGGVRHFAEGSENHVAQIAPAGSWRVWGEPETGGEGYVPFAPSKRPRSRAITEEIVRRLGGDPRAIQWNANGSVTDWTYDPKSGSLYSASDAGRAGHKTRKVKVKGKNGKVTIKEIEYFDLGAVEKKLKSSAKATLAFNKNLEKVTDRAGADVAAALSSMGEDGVKLAAKMAKGSKKYVDQMSKALLDLQKTAKASLTDYTRALNADTKLDAAFAKNLAVLAGRGHGDLAAQLAAQNDTAAQQLAAAAVKDNKKASSANSAAKKANAALTSEQVEQLVAIIAAIKTSKTGIHDVADATGLGEDVIIDIGRKAKGQIVAALGSRSARFTADLAKAVAGKAYANGGIREGIYSTAGGAVTFAEPSTGGEAYIPLGAAKRDKALPVLADVMSRFGVGRTAAQDARVVIIREQGPLVGAQNWNITGGGNAEDTARQIASRHAFQLRRLARGGAAAR
ncbi:MULTISPECIES: hypothetical protein [unclassified Streptomyces]|uniref:hypothetical protein n=1 Tax=unclassified Streptomyces TaxID=2593676 RepID=UPI00081BA8E6|nr:hypothetical protein [Streptomyces sp. BvitLS-983]MYX88488.1 hypothetical protein [Streptomyces sp. SID4915]SCE17256.1 hypothetical protein GA0115250_1447121 [Streptomyces sp. BvitLS-983]